MRHRKLVWTLTIIGLLLCGQGIYFDQVNTCNTSTLATTEFWGYVLGVVMVIVAAILCGRSLLQKVVYGIAVLLLGLAGFIIMIDISFSRCFVF